MKKDIDLKKIFSEKENKKLELKNEFSNTMYNVVDTSINTYTDKLKNELFKIKENPESIWKDKTLKSLIIVQLNLHRYLNKNWEEIPDKLKEKIFNYISEIFLKRVNDYSSEVKKLLENSELIFEYIYRKFQKKLEAPEKHIINKKEFLKLISDIQENLNLNTSVSKNILVKFLAKFFSNINLKIEE